jgi:hypothetical protein
VRLLRVGGRFGCLQNVETSNPTLCRSCRLAFTKPRFADSLEIVKFICKDLWSAAFNKQIDNLRTNHRVRSLSTR